MRFLDVDSGAGDVSLLLADPVGPDGQVVGADLRGAAVDHAHTRVAARGLANVTFVHGDPTELVFDRPFDAVAGRYVRQSINIQAAALRKLATRVRPGGVVVFHENEWDALTPQPCSPTYEMIARWAVPAI